MSFLVVILAIFAIIQSVNQLKEPFITHGNQWCGWVTIITAMLVLIVGAAG